MKEFIVTEAAKIEAEEGKRIYPPRQRDITLGAGLMLVGVIKAFLIMASLGGSNRGEKFFVYLFLLCLLFSAYLLLSQLSPKQRGLTIGATLIFIGSVLSIQFGMVTDPPGALLIPALLLPVILFWVKLVRTFMRTFFDKEVLPEKNASPHPQPSLNLAAASASALQSAQNASDVEPTTNRMKEAEMVRHFSVTENTTESLKNKQSFTQ